jgi:hypothetical protein
MRCQFCDYHPEFGSELFDILPSSHISVNLDPGTNQYLCSECLDSVADSVGELAVFDINEEILSNENKKATSDQIRRLHEAYDRFRRPPQKPPTLSLRAKL